MHDVIIVGGGPAGLSAALILGRCLRRVLVIDEGHPRNARSGGLHGFLSRDGIRPRELLAIARDEVSKYGVELRQAHVTHARRIERCFEVELESGEQMRCRRLLIATGVRDRIPELPGIDAMYGKSVLHCPFCDGWEMRGRALAAYAPGKEGCEFALGLRSWSTDIVLLTDGTTPPDEARGRLERMKIPIETAPIERLEGRDGMLERIVFKNGRTLAREGLFFHLGVDPTSRLAEELGCHVTKDEGVTRKGYEETTVPGVYVAGDATKDVLFAIVAAAEGAKAAYAIHRSLREEDDENL
jgi:thioredoxin reductase